MARQWLMLLLYIYYSKAMPMTHNMPWITIEKNSLENVRNRFVCRVNGTCIPTNNSTCFGVKVPYPYTSNDISGLSRHQITDRLQMLEGLHRVPKCWAAIQPLLCALFMPRCDPETKLINLPTHEMCKIAQSPCRILNDTLQDWIPFFNCDDAEHYPPDCKSDMKEMRFNTTGQCVSPLVPTDNPASFYDGIDGCGLPCADPMLTDQERGKIHGMVSWAATFTLLCNLFAVMTFAAEWRSTKNYPAMILVLINCCFIISNIGWLVQFMPGTREDVVCRKDGTLRLSEPSDGENLSCVIVFVAIYYSLIAACVWFVIFSYAWYLRVKSSAAGKIPVRFEKQAAYFHLVAWSLPLVLTISTMATSQIDGNSVAGICFVGYYSHSSRVLLLLFPVICAVVVGAYFFIRVMKELISVNIDNYQIISKKNRSEIWRKVIRVFFFLLGCMCCVVTTIVCHLYEIQNEPIWRRSLRKYLICRVNPLESAECKLGARPSVAMMQVHLLLPFISGILMSSWVWRSSTVDIWKQVFSRMFNKDTPRRAVKKKHKMIALAYSKRKEIHDTGRMSISLNETRDPAGLNLDLNCEESRDFSSTWAAKLPKLVTRRGGLIDVTTDSNSSHSHRRRNSYDSEINYSVRRVSVESRRHSLDSQISVRIEELTAKRTKTVTPRPLYGKRRGCRRRTRDRFRTRRGSSTSQDSQMDFQILTALAMRSPNILPNLMRGRPGVPGFGATDITSRVPMIRDYVSDDETTNAGAIDDASLSDRQSVRVQPIKAIRAADTDSDTATSRNPLSSRRTRKTSTSSGRRKQRDSGQFDSRRQMRKRHGTKKSDDRQVNRSKDSGSSKKMRTSDADTRGKYTACKTDDSEQDGDEWNDASEADSNCESTDKRGDSARRPARRVDAATQVCTLEAATQTETSESLAHRAHQSTQMTPPFHIRLINKTLNSNGVTAPTPRYNSVWAQDE